MSTPSTPELSADIQRRVAGVIASWASTETPQAVVQAIEALDEPALREVQAVLDEVEDLDDRTVYDVLGRDGQPKAEHHYRSCRAEDAESSWDHRPASPTIRLLRDALLDDVLGPTGLNVHGAQGVVDALADGKRLLFISNHESVFDLAVLPWALSKADLHDLSERLTFFVNPKIFNIAFVNLFVCKAIGVIKMPQSPRIATNESVMRSEDIQRRAAHGFGVAERQLADGGSLVIYPEGLRNGGVLHRFARAYLRLIQGDSSGHIQSGDVLLVPWAHQGLRDLERLPDPCPPITVTFGEPVHPNVLFGEDGSTPMRIAGHMAGYLVARLLPETQRGLYGDNPSSYLEHPHFRQRVQAHTLVDIGLAKEALEKR
ncbi:MAG: 1-acyl-sn-glycerol-3-phosphate acyltransferase [Kiritimatiellia bacterium]|jgi:1-acyl-sn-glycerol-3-phosphate acyltransferase